MSKRVFFVLVIFMVGLSFYSCNHSNSELFVSLNGDDENRGTKKNPFISMNRALEEFVKMKSDNDYPETSITIPS